MAERDGEDGDDAAWLLARESGQTGPEVSDTTAARYAALQARIADLPAIPAGVSRRPRWQQGVFAAIEAAEATAAGQGDPVAGSIDGAMPRRARPRRWAIAAGMVAAAVVAIALYRRGGERLDGPGALPTLAFQTEFADRPHRGTEPSVGDHLIVRAVIEGIGELRIYDAAGLEVARCTAVSPGCTVERSAARTTLQLTVPLRAAGRLRAVLFAAPLAGASGRLDGDVEAAVRAGIGVTTRDVDVR